MSTITATQTKQHANTTLAKVLRTTQVISGILTLIDMIVLIIIFSMSPNVAIAEFVKEHMLILNIVCTATPIVFGVTTMLQIEKGKSDDR